MNKPYVLEGIITEESLWDYLTGEREEPTATFIPLNPTREEDRPPCY